MGRMRVGGFFKGKSIALPKPISTNDYIYIIYIIYIYIYL